jgi:hypothetical protein
VNLMSDRDEDRRRRNATRYLCVGAHLDERFRTAVLQHVLGAEHRAVAPSYGIDVGPVIRHCLDARRRAVLRDVGVTGALLIAFLISFWQLLSLLLFFQSVRMGLRALARLDGDVPGAVRSGIISVLLGILALSTGVTALVSLATSAVGMGAYETIGLSAGRVMFSVSLGLIGTFAVVLAYRLRTHELVLEELTENRFRPERAPVEPRKYRTRMAYIGAAQSGNVTMYARSQEARPFVGSGVVQLNNSWSLALPLVPDEDSSERAETPLSIGELYDRMRRALVTLSDPHRPDSERVVGLSLQDRLFAVGLLPPGHELLREGGEPVYRISRGRMLRLSDQERNVATHYLTIRMSGWNGELEVAVFLYFSIRGGMLYIEFLSAVLPPIRDAYHAVDSYERMNGNVVLRHVAGAILETPGALINSPVNILRPVAEAIRSQLDLRSQLQEISNRVAYDFGAVGSVREYGAEWHRANMLHYLDAERHVRLVERRLLDALREVLQAFGMRTEEFDERTKVIIDNSTKIENSTFTNSAVAAGTQARTGPLTQPRTNGKQ